MSLPLNMVTNGSDKYQLARYNMVEQQVRPWSLGDEQVLQLIGTLRREEFVPDGLQDMAFMDIQLPLLGDDGEEAIANGHCMMPPRVEARVLQDLKLQPNDNVLEIGTGSGYMAALMSRLAKQVTTIEIEPALVELARANLHRAQIKNVDVVLDDGSNVKAIGGTYDVIALSGSVHEVPAAFFDKLNEGGRLIAFVGNEPMMRTTLYTRTNGKIEVSQPWDTVVARLKGFPEAPRFKF
jgi:protein-L-isoaspartate(D-aspartate) O-methyltransferase